MVKNNAYEGAVGAYLRDIEGTKSYSLEQELSIARRMRSGDESALEELVRGNLPFAIAIAKNYRGQGVEFDDLIAYSNLGLVEAAKKFDPDRGLKFITYAVWFIKHNILEAIANERSVRVPIEVMQNQKKIAHATEMFEKEKGRKASLKEIDTIADRLGFKGVSKECALATYEMIELDATISPHNPRSGSIQERYADPAQRTDNAALKREAEQIVTDALASLPPYWRDVIERYYGLGSHHEHELKEIAARRGVKYQTIQQRRDKAIKQLRAGPHSGALAQLHAEKAFESS